MLSNRLAENAIKLNEKLNQLRETLRPAIEAARARQSSSFQLKDDEALIAAGKLLGVE